MPWLAEISKIFFSETNELTEPKLYMNDHWNVLYQVTVFYADRKSKMVGSNVKLSPAVAAILNFIPEQKT
jgi:hypothetical protein